MEERKLPNKKSLMNRNLEADYPLRIMELLEHALKLDASAEKKMYCDASAIHKLGELVQNQDKDAPLDEEKFTQFFSADERKVITEPEQIPLLLSKMKPFLLEIAKKQNATILQHDANIKATRTLLMEDHKADDVLSCLPLPPELATQVQEELLAKQEPNFLWVESIYAKLQLVMNGPHLQHFDATAQQAKLAIRLLQQNVEKNKKPLAAMLDKIKKFNEQLVKLESSLAIFYAMQYCHDEAYQHAKSAYRHAEHYPQSRFVTTHLAAIKDTALGRYNSYAAYLRKRRDFTATFPITASIAAELNQRLLHLIKKERLFLETSPTEKQWIEEAAQFSPKGENEAKIADEAVISRTDEVMAELMQNMVLDLRQNEASFFTFSKYAQTIFVFSLQTLQNKKADLSELAASISELEAGIKFTQQFITSRAELNLLSITELTECYQHIDLFTFNKNLLEMVLANKTFATASDKPKALQGGGADPESRSIFETVAPKRKGLSLGQASRTSAFQCS